MLISSLGLLLVGCQDDAVDFAFVGPGDGTTLNAQTLPDAVWEARTDMAVPESIDFALDRRDLDVEPGENGLRWSADDLADGEYTLTVRSTPEDAETEPEVLHAWQFGVDTTPPEIELTSPDSAVVAGEPVVVAGTTEPGATLTVADQEVTAGDDGGFEIELPDAPDGEVEIVTADAAGNRSDDAFTLVTVPSRVEVEHIRGVHVTAYAWATPSYRERILAMIDDGIINTVALTLKDEGGQVGWDSDVELAE
ncbi:MAG: Ig-like domain-containing protein, partial [Ilumatobacteraceae bacterium]